MTLAGSVSASGSLSGIKVDAKALALIAPRRQDMAAVTAWRQEPGVRMGLRTPYMIPEEMQNEWYDSVICSRTAPHRYWSVVDQSEPNWKRLVGFCGLTDIAWENGHAEISLMVAPEAQGKGVALWAVAAVLAEAFNNMRLVTVFGECYEHNPAIGFWNRALDDYNGGWAMIPNRKWWGGRMNAGLMFWFTAEAFREAAH